MPIHCICNSLGRSKCPVHKHGYFEKPVIKQPIEEIKLNDPIADVKIEDKPLIEFEKKMKALKEFNEFDDKFDNEQYILGAEERIIDEYIEADKAEIKPDVVEPIKEKLVVKKPIEKPKRSYTKKLVLNSNDLDKMSKAALKSICKKLKIKTPRKIVDILNLIKAHKNVTIQS